MPRIGKKRRRLDPVFPPPDSRTMVQVSPVAIMAMVAVTLDLPHIAAALPGVALCAAVQYVAGLVFLARRATAAKMNRVLGGVSHDALTRLREQDRFNVSGLVLAFIKLAHAAGVPGHLCLDDTFIPHERSKKMEGVYWDWDHALRRNVLGTRLVVLIWTDGFLRIPVGFAVWHKEGAREKYRSKNELARMLLRWAIHRGIRPEYVAFDNWYASRDNMKLVVKELGLEFVTRLKKNARLLWEGRRLQARTIGGRMLAGKRLCSRKGTWARATTVVVGELGAMTFVAVKDDLDGQGMGIRYLLASAPRLSAALVVERYRSRWIIETFFEDLKQPGGSGPSAGRTTRHMSLASYQGRTVEGQTSHVALSFLGAVVLDAMRKAGGLTLGEAREAACRLVFARTARGECELVTLAPAPGGAIDALDEAKQVVTDSSSSVSQLRFPEAAYARKVA
jgi:hypothetical protein